MSWTVGCSDEKKLWVSGEMWVRGAVEYGSAIAALHRICGIYAEMDGIIHQSCSSDNRNFLRYCVGRVVH